MHPTEKLPAPAAEIEQPPAATPRDAEAEPFGAAEGRHRFCDDMPDSMRAQARRAERVAQNQAAQGAVDRLILLLAAIGRVLVRIELPQRAHLRPRVLVMQAAVG